MDEAEGTMIIVYGTRLFGRADAVEGVGHVCCRFVHVMLVPLVPIETLFVLPDGRGMKLPFSFKAAASGWLRGGALITGTGCLVAALANLASGELLLGIVCGVVGGLSLGAFPFWGWIFGMCSAARRDELLRMLGVPVPAAAPPLPGPAYAPTVPAPFVPMPGYGYGTPSGPMQPAGGFGQPNMYGPPPGMGPMGPTANPAPPYGAHPQSYGSPPPGWDPNRRY
jgi:hypothetical protein